MFLKGLVKGSKPGNWEWYNDTQVVNWDRGLKNTLDNICQGFRPYTLIYERRKEMTAGSLKLKN
jgi:hypothetical protein